MAPATILDTSAAYAWRDQRDPNHHAARRYMAAGPRMYHTTEAIIEELYTLALRRLGWGPARRTVALMRQSSFISVHQDDQSLSWAVVDEFPGVPLSYADATLVALSRGLSISTVFSFDSDFRLAGFTTVP